MAERSTFVKIDRNILNWGWYTDANTFRVFMHLILNANIKDGKFLGVSVKRGQLITGRKKLAAELKMSEQSVRTAILHLKLTNEITITPYSHFSLISIVNYDKYQDVPTSRSTSKSTNKQPATNQQSTTIKEYKNNKNEKKEDMPSAVPEIRDWERGIPEQFVGRFPNEAAWKKFWGIEDDEP